MGSLGATGTNPRADLVVTQVSFGGFDESISAKQLAEFLEINAGVTWRCRVKKMMTPPESYPDFSACESCPVSTDESVAKVAAPHAFVHFAHPDAAKRAIAAAGRSDLVLGGRVLRVSSGAESSYIAQRRRNIDPFKFSAVGVELGHLVSRDEFLMAWKRPSADFIVDPFDGCCQIRFTKETAFSLKGIKKIIAINCDFKLQFLVRDMDDIKVWKDEAPFVLLLHLSSTPLVYYRTADDDIYESVPFSLLDDEDPWIRTTDFTMGGAIGRSNACRITLSPRFGPKLEKALTYMKSHRIPESRPRRPLLLRNEPGFAVPMAEPFFSIKPTTGISFGTLFMVNAVVHKGIINQHHLTGEFFDLLRTQSDKLNDAALRHIWAYKRPIFDACRRLKVVQDWLLRNPKLANGSKVADDNAEVRRVVITPTKAHCLPPEVELSNRVLRHYREVADRFLRVTFTDESMQQLNSSVLNYYVAPIVRDIISNAFPQKTTVFPRIKSILSDGFHLCGRRYSFLAFSSNQLRDQSAWFFADSEKVTVASIRRWMGRFTNKNVAKCAARMGQCFSSTYATVRLMPEEVNEELEDVERNGYVFSDGIGKISPGLGMEVAERLQLTESPPSAYQIRYAGCKGVVAVWPEKDDKIRLSLRPSMNKFESNHNVLEIVSWTRFQPGFLNRQIVTLLSSLEVPDRVFWKMQEEMICKLDHMLTDTNTALEVLTTSCAEQGNTAAMMLSAGFKPQTEPHLKDMLLCVKAAQLRDLLSKARIFVPKGRWLMGCLDELSMLQQGQCFIQASSPSLENCFSKHGSRFLATKKDKQIVVGTVAIAKNPCLHPGDIRILEAVDVPELHHLVDCLVFPQNGERPHANEASGSDLDGDLYFVTWEPNLIPPSKQSWVPLDYTPAESKLQPREVSHKDIIDFFVRNMVSESLGVICNAHVVHADLSEHGAMDEKCIQLAKMAATAVDFPKTGIQVTMPASLKPKLYPDFMEKHEHKSYKSEKILGKLYRSIRDASSESSMQPELTSSYEALPYDTDLEVPGALDYIQAASENKGLYDAQLNALLGQYRIRTEAEVVIGQISSLPKYNSRKQGEIKERAKNAYAALHREFRQIFESEAGSQLPSDEKDRVLMRKASAWYQVTYRPNWVKKTMERGGPDAGEVAPRLSFAWIAADYLAGIKMSKQG
ncbi:putative RNA-dependent RNA polymerase SHL2 [Apostasia shenzhenica]|uniref:RNA-dependent RNA polymerase n=1 Tax=Apostasia shenzhenica TaxID=1088818 RepID=A0A2I0AQN5_9ASPA|nr:putative RNA-dependent RNA polymerase SHL2 [Apostasia shenzhenica]